MPLTEEQKEVKKIIYNQIKLGEPIEPDDDRHVNVYTDPEIDPVEKLKAHIELTDGESIQFFSGFRGSGKTSELYRLRKKLEADGYFVIYANALDYVNPSDEIDITDLLVVVAGAFSDAIEKEFGENPIHESYWARFKNYLYNTNINITEVTLKTEANSPAQEVIGGLKAGLDLKLELKDTPSFRQNLQKLLSGRIGGLKRDIDSFIESGVKLIKKEKGDDTKIVFIFDQLEQIRGSLFNEQAVIQSVERTFAQNGEKLKLPYLHAVYTVPPWIKFVMPNSFTDPIVILHSIKQWQNDSQRTKIGKGDEIFHQIILKRFGDKGFADFFGETTANRPKADKLVANCGGSLRDVLRLLNQVVLPAQNLPFSNDDIDRAISSVKSDFLPIAIDDAHWLEEISRSRSSALPNIEGENVGRLTRFLDTHFVLYLKNGDEWYDIHPLIRDEVSKIVRDNPKKAT
jgi:hypothetical protein